MAIEIDSEVEAVVEFMAQSIPASRLVAVANGLAALAPSLWGGYESEGIAPLRLVSSPIRDDRRKPASSSESGLEPGCADGGSVAVAAVLR